MVAAAVLVLAAGLAAGQAEGSAMPEALRKQIDAQYVGEWVGKGSHGGEAFTEEWSLQWSEGRAWLVLRLTTVIKGKKSVAGGVLGWDAVDRCLLLQLFDSDGGSATVRWKEFSPAGWKGQASGSYLGKRWESPAKLEFEKDTVRYEDVTVGQPWVSVATRKPAPRPPSAHEHLRGLAYFIGDWEAKNDRGGVTRWTFRWGRDRNVIENEIVEQGPDGKVAFANKGMLGWDPQARRITNWCIDEAGRPLVFLWAVRDGQSWETWAPGGTGGWVLTAQDKDSWRMESPGGRPLVFRRRAGE